MARKGAGPKLVNGMDGSSEAKKRLRVILETISGERTVAEACSELGIGEARFHELRAEVLAVALLHLEPRPAGRPAKEEPESSEVDALKAELKELRIELQVSRVREEISAVMPHLLKPRKKTKPEDGMQELFGPGKGT